MTGQDLVDLLDDRLAGYANAADTDVKTRFLNEAKDEVWVIVKELNDDYFGMTTQSTNVTAEDYFPNLTPSSRSYALPSTLREIKFIECTTLGYEDVRFTYRSMTSTDWREARRAGTANQQSSISVEEYIYTIFGSGQFLLAEYPATTLAITIFGVRALDDFELGDDIDASLVPYAKKMADYAAQKLLMSLQDETLSEEYRAQWREDVITITAGAAPRNQADAQFVEDFMG